LCIYVHLYKLFTLCSSTYPFLPLPQSVPTTPLHVWQNLLNLPVLRFCRRKNIKEKKRNMIFFQFWDKDSYTGNFLGLFPCMYVLQTQLIHLF
jgi:hypothetical protein